MNIKLSNKQMEMRYRYVFHSFLQKVLIFILYIANIGLKQLYAYFKFFNELNII